ncbi:MAG: WYL domain-containing protein [Anaerolineales bacterium]|nr:WYL domain-containing protein [Anaerolineales bacterium]
MNKKLVSGNGRDNQIRRTARILEIIQQIASSPGYWSRSTLSEHHEIGERMIQKDIELIRWRLNLPLIHNGTAYSFERLPQLPTAAYSFSEAVALLMAAKAAQSLPGVNSAELAAAIARIESIFPDDLRPLLREATEKLPRSAIKSHRQTMLSLLNRSLVERKKLKIRYATSSRAGKVSERCVEPYHLMPYGRSWHLIAFDHKRKATLQFKVDRIQEAILLDETYFIPHDFDVDAYLGTGWGIMRGSATEPEEVVLIFEPEAGRWVAEEEWHSSQNSDELNDGRIEITFHVGITPEMVSWLLYYGGNVRVKRPLWLRAEVQKQHEKGMKKQEQINA